MRRLLAGLIGLLMASAAHAEWITVTPAGSNGGSFPPSGCVTANGVIFNNATPCDSGLTYAGSGGQVSLNGAALGATTALLINPTSASGLLLDAQVNGTSQWKVSSAGATTQLGLGLFPAGSACTAGNQGISIGVNTYGFYQGTNQLGVCVAGTLRGDYGVSASQGWTFSSNGNGVSAQGGFRASAAFTSYDIGIAWNGTGIISAASVGQIGFTASATLGTQANDTILTRAAAANWQFGAANVNGAPVPQTISFQGALAGSATNTASVNTTLVGSLGTGTGTNGDIIIQTGVKTSTGTAQATPTTALTLKGETQAVLTGGTLTVGTMNSATGLFVCETAGLLSSGISTCVASDRSVKHDIVAINDNDLLDKVLGQHGVRFTYDEAKGAPGRRIGVIANDWEKNFPELVDFDTDGIRHFDYAATWGLSVEMFRRLRADNDNLRTRVEFLESMAR